MHEFRLKKIQTEIRNARKALMEWTDHKTEALIDLDSIFVEIGEYQSKMDQEKAQVEFTLSELREGWARSEKDFHRQFEAFTNEIQELKLENETISNELKKTRTEAEIQKRNFSEAEKQYHFRISQITQDFETRMLEQQFQMKSRIGELTSELQTIQTEKKRISDQAKKFEEEIQTIRQQMMVFLKADSVQTFEIPREKDPQSAIEPEIVVEKEAPKTVEDYLKRFGY